MKSKRAAAAVACFVIAIILAFGTNIWEFFTVEDVHLKIASSELYWISNILFFAGFFILIEGSMEERFAVAYKSAFAIPQLMLETFYHALTKKCRNISDFIDKLKAWAILIVFLFVIASGIMHIGPWKTTTILYESWSQVLSPENIAMVQWAFCIAMAYAILLLQLRSYLRKRSSGKA